MKLKRTLSLSVIKTFKNNQSLLRNNTSLCSPQLPQPIQILPKLFKNRVNLIQRSMLYLSMTPQSYRMFSKTSITRESFLKCPKISLDMSNQKSSSCNRFILISTCLNRRTGSFLEIFQTWPVEEVHQKRQYLESM